MKDRYLILTARIISVLFTPFYFPLVAFIALFLFSYLKLLPTGYKLYVLAMIYLFTVALPLLSIYLYRRINGWTHWQSGHRTRRIVPYLLSMTSYGCCLYAMKQLHMPYIMLSVIMAALVIQAVCALLNNWVKVSTHSAAAGGVIGALLAFSLIFSFNPTWWLCLSILLTGAVGSSRIVLRQHSLHQVGLGVLVGFLCAFVCILYIRY